MRTVNRINTTIHEQAEVIANSVATQLDWSIGSHHWVMVRDCVEGALRDEVTRMHVRAAQEAGRLSTKWWGRFIGLEGSVELETDIRDAMRSMVKQL